eukprot:scaffold4.g4594.t1
MQPDRPAGNGGRPAAAAVTAATAAAAADAPSPNDQHSASIVAAAPTPRAPPPLTRSGTMMATAASISAPRPAAALQARPRAAKRARAALPATAGSASVYGEAFVPSDSLFRPAKEGPVIMNGSVLHSATFQQIDVIQSMQVRDLRERTKEIPDELLVCLVGDMITEEALPTYMAMVNTLDGIRDETGRSQHPYAQWTRRWIAEEKRHGDLLVGGTGMDPKTENHPYLGFTFTSFQERSTKISHGGTARLAKKYGDENLAWLCGRIAQDESRHEAAYTRTMDAIYKKDPNGAVCAFADMMRKKIVMPAHFMDDGVHADTNNGRNLFEDFAEIAQNIGVYTAEDYCRNIEHLIERWNIKSLQGLNEKGRAAQEFVCALPDKVRRLAEIKEVRKAKGPSANVKFDWLYDRAACALASRWPGARCLGTSAAALQQSAVQMEVFDGPLKARHRDRAAREPVGTDPLLDEVAERLLDRLEDCTRSFPRAVVLGGAGAQVLERLGGGRAGIESVAYLDTSQELRIACTVAQQEREGGVSARVSPLARVRDAGNLLTRAGLALPTVDVDEMQAGESNALLQLRRALGRDTALAAAAVYAALFGEGEGEGVIYMTGWAPHPSQQKAAARGSATLSFEDLSRAMASQEQQAQGQQQQGQQQGQQRAEQQQEQQGGREREGEAARPAPAPRE